MRTHSQKKLAFSSALRRCEECQTGTLPTAGSGEIGSSLFFLKSSPSPDEISAGFAFAGEAGKALVAALDALGISPLDAYGTNAVKCPSGLIERCAPLLLSEISAVNPSVIIAMGPDARKALSLASGLELSDAIKSPLQWRSRTIIVISEDPLKALRSATSKRRLWEELKLHLPGTPDFHKAK